MKKTCFICKEVKPLSDFHRHPEMRDGHLNKCILCARTYARQHRNSNIEKVRRIDRERGTLPERKAAREAYAATEAYKESQRRAKPAWQANNSEKRSAHVAVGNAVRDGVLMRETCCLCGLKAQAHHEDYQRQLDVIWLCTRHHSELHKRRRCRGRGEKRAIPAAYFQSPTTKEQHQCQ